MWNLYCLPGRIIAEIGYLFPGRGQLWASQRRRESGFAAFIFATGFWAIFCVFALPLILAAVVSGTRNGAQDQRNRSTVEAVSHSTAAAAIPAMPTTGTGEPSRDSAVAKPSPPRREQDAKSRIIFAPPHEVVQPLPATTPSDPAN